MVGGIEYNMYIDLHHVLNLLAKIKKVLKEEDKKETILHLHRG